MKVWYVTFGQRFSHDPHQVLGRAAHPNGWLTLVVPDRLKEHEVREYLFRMITNEWAFLYDQLPDQRLFDRGELMRLDWETDRLTVHEHTYQLSPLPAPI